MKGFGQAIAVIVVFVGAIVSLTIALFPDSQIEAIYICIMAIICVIATLFYINWKDAERRLQTQMRGERCWHTMIERNIWLPKKEHIVGPYKTETNDIIKIIIKSPRGFSLLATFNNQQSGEKPIVEDTTRFDRDFRVAAGCTYSFKIIPKGRSIGPIRLMLWTTTDRSYRFIATAR